MSGKQCSCDSIPNYNLSKTFDNTVEKVDYKKNEGSESDIMSKINKCLSDFWIGWRFQ